MNTPTEPPYEPRQGDTVRVVDRSPREWVKGFQCHGALGHIKDIRQGGETPAGPQPTTFLVVPYAIREEDRTFDGNDGYWLVAAEFTPAAPPVWRISLSDLTDDERIQVRIAARCALNEHIALVLPLARLDTHWGTILGKLRVAKGRLDETATAVDLSGLPKGPVWDVLNAMRDCITKLPANRELLATISRAIHEWH